jgi:16S rRNA (guanine966-N2)-methyltransferase
VNVRLVAGKYGGRILQAPKSTRTHPMGERIRNALFNSIGPEIVGASVLDAFAGTGAIGLEALSRGAANATFVERDKLAQKVLQENIASLQATDARLIKSSVGAWLDTTGADQRYDIIFVDPPYNDEQFSTVSRIFGLLKPNGLMVLSHTDRGEVPIQDEIVVVDNRSYGNAFLTFYRREDS